MYGILSVEHFPAKAETFGENLNRMTKRVRASVLEGASLQS